MYSSDPWYGIAKSKSFSAGGFCKYDISEKLSLRLQANVSNFKTTYNNYNYKDPAPWYHPVDTLESYFKQTYFKIIPAVLYKIKKGRLTYYAGGELPVKIITYHTDEKSITNNYAGYQNGYQSKYSYKISWGMAIGAGVVIGMEWNIWKKLWLGCELSDALSYYRFNGTSTEEVYNYDSTNSPWLLTSFSQQVKSYGMVITLPTLSLNVGYHF
jgi:hypothetical protein